MAKLDPDDVVAATEALRCAELTATAEDLRARIRAGEVGLANKLVRIENLADWRPRSTGSVITPAPNDRQRRGSASLACVITFLLVFSGRNSDHPVSLIDQTIVTHPVLQYAFLARRTPLSGLKERCCTVRKFCCSANRKPDSSVHPSQRRSLGHVAY
jgi:hypothetical protein